MFQTARDTPTSAPGEFVFLDIQGAGNICSPGDVQGEQLLLTVPPGLLYLSAELTLALLVASGSKLGAQGQWGISWEVVFG